MELIAAWIRGFGRLLDTTIKLDQKLIAIVGPNEAGKTTLLDALAFVEQSATLPLSRRSRAQTHYSESEPVVSLHYRLSDPDRESLADFELEDLPVEFRVHRSADDSSPTFEVLPAPRKSVSSLEEPIAELKRVLSQSLPLTPLSADTGNGYEGEGASADNKLLGELDAFLQELEDHLQIPANERESIETLIEQVDAQIEKLKSFDETERIRELLSMISEWGDSKTLAEKVESMLWTRAPALVTFSESHRILAASYRLYLELPNEAPASLKNLAQLAGLDLSALVQAVLSDNISQRDTIKNKANFQLEQYFSHAWKQSNLKVELNVEGNLLRINIVEDGIHASVFDERSAGLRMFVALAAFLATRDSDRRTILLVDEAETHLHINAQADLVQMFSDQNQADKIIYTTHSPACLPADLGVGIRAVVPDSAETSFVENSFWRQEGEGFSSLMFAMGASAAAFTPARFAVIAEGATDMILLPTLIRAATGLEKLPYQVAPGLSEMPKAAYPKLDYQAVKVAFLVDGDEGGQRLAKAMRRTIPEDRIVTLGVHGIENTLDECFYKKVFRDLLQELNDGITVDDLPELPSARTESWPRILEKWAKDRQWQVPSKLKMATHVVELDSVQLSAEGVFALKEAHFFLLKALGLDS